jgi:hypothetical protein
MVDLARRVTPPRAPVRGRGRILFAALLAALPAAFLPAPVALAGTEDEPADAEAPRARAELIAQVEYIEDSTGRSFWDPSVFVSYRQAHAQLWAGEFTKGVEVGGYVPDRRRSTYAAFYRYRDDFDHVIDVSTEQLVGSGFVAYAGLRYIRVLDEAAEDRDLLQPTLGFDKYYGDYHFFSARVIRDPREDHELTFVLANRFARAAGRWLTLGVVPRTDGSTGWFVQGRWKIWRAGVGRFDRFDFTDIDRTVFNVGVQFGL